jgi:hypothetical protein
MKFIYIKNSFVGISNSTNHLGCVDASFANLLMFSIALIYWNVG